MLADDYGREVSQVRVSLTDRCNFDCVYCHNEGLGDTRGPMAARDHEMDTGGGVGDARWGRRLIMARHAHAGRGGGR